MQFVEVVQEIVSKDPVLVLEAILPHLWVVSANWLTACECAGHSAGAWAHWKVVV